MAVGLLCALLFGCGRSEFAGPQGTPTLGTQVSLQGRARDYALPQGELFLVGKSARHPVGRIDPDGRFTFRLPEHIEFPAMSASLAPEWREYLAPADQIANVEHWGKLEVEPPGLRVANFGVVFRAQHNGRLRGGDLILTNTDPGRASEPGEMVAVWLWADRDGRLLGEAQIYAPDANFVAAPWRVELKRGWNLISSRTRRGYYAAEHLTQPLPGDLEWVAFDPSAAGLKHP